MSGFDADWLALREAADHRARNVALRDTVCGYFSGREHVAIVDFACGAGSNLRALAAHLPGDQTWRLVDHDPLLLAAAQRALRAWADRVEGENPLVLRKDGRRLEIVFDERDLADFSGGALEGGVDLVTAAAFFDLVSKDWIAGFCAEMAKRRLPLYAVLSYCGEEKWSPPHAADAPMLAAFHRHQAGDKGFGPAAGPHAAEALRQALEAQSYAVVAAPSPWRLRARDEALIRALADGAARAVEEAKLLAAPTIENWRWARRQAEVCEIGHVDVFARPP
jgi:hypothetical protein